MALGHAVALRRRALAGRLGRQRAPADRGAEARLRRCAPLRRRPARDDGRRAGARFSTREYLAGARQADRHEARAGFRPRHAAARRHGLPHRGRCRRHDGVAHPVELHGVRLRRGGAGHRHQPAEPRLRLRARAGASQPRSAPQAALSHDHPGLRDPERRAGDELRADGRHHAAAGPHAAHGAHDRLRPEPADRDRRPALPGDERPRRQHGARVSAGDPDGARAPRAPHSGARRKATWTSAAHRLPSGSTAATWRPRTRGAIPSRWGFRF